jgi:hypothetical protein
MCGGWILVGLRAGLKWCGAKLNQHLPQPIRLKGLPERPHPWALYIRPPVAGHQRISVLHHNGEDALAGREACRLWSGGRSAELRYCQTGQQLQFWSVLEGA